MKESDVLKINIKVFGLEKPLSFNIPREQEEMYRKAAEFMNTALKEYRNKSYFASMEELLSMVILSTVVTSLRASGKVDINPLLNELKSIDNELQAYLNEAVSK